MPLHMNFRRFLQLERAAIHFISLIVVTLSPSILPAQDVPLWEIGPIISITPFRIGFPFNERDAGVGGRVGINLHKNDTHFAGDSNHDPPYKSFLCDFFVCEEVAEIKKVLIAES